jgi:anthranilate synthase component 2
MKTKLLLLDNDDSFVYNLYQYLSESFKGEISVINNKSLTLDEVNAFDIIVLSPGPDIPEKAGIMIPIIQNYYQTKPILGVCLGHQAICEAFGGKLKNLETIYHGIKSNISLDKIREPLFGGLPNHITVGRYHSWTIDETSLPNELLVTARDEKGVIMAITHRNYLVKGLQFHPESYITKEGNQIIKNFLSLVPGKKQSESEGGLR